jgi:hypothetical protein
MRDGVLHFRLLAGAGLCSEHYADPLRDAVPERVPVSQPVAIRVSVSEPERLRNTERVAIVNLHGEPDGDAHPKSLSDAVKNPHSNPKPVSDAHKNSDAFADAQPDAVVEPERLAHGFSHPVGIAERVPELVAVSEHDSHRNLDSVADAVNHANKVADADRNPERVADANPDADDVADAVSDSHQKRDSDSAINFYQRHCWRWGRRCRRRRGVCVLIWLVIRNAVPVAVRLSNGDSHAFRVRERLCFNHAEPDAIAESVDDSDEHRHTDAHAFTDGHKVSLTVWFTEGKQKQHSEHDHFADLDTIAITVAVGLTIAFRHGLAFKHAFLCSHAFVNRLASADSFCDQIAGGYGDDLADAVQKLLKKPERDAHPEPHDERHKVSDEELNAQPEPDPLRDAVADCLGVSESERQPIRQHDSL